MAKKKKKAVKKKAVKKKVKTKPKKKVVKKTLAKAVKKNGVKRKKAAIPRVSLKEFDPVEPDETDTSPQFAFESEDDPVGATDPHEDDFDDDDNGVEDYPENEGG